MNEKIYNLIENEDGTLTAVINEGVIRLEEYPFMPKLFERNENVTVLAVPSTLESVYINFQNSFPNLKKITVKSYDRSLKSLLLENGFQPDMMDMTLFRI